MSEVTKQCDRCREDKPLTSFATHARAKDGHRRSCRSCVLSAASQKNTVRVRTAKAYDAARERYDDRVIDPIPFPGGAVEFAPWRGAPKVAPFQVNLRRHGPVPTAARYPACSRECAEVVLREWEPHVYTELRGTRLSHYGHRAALRPLRVHVTGVDREATCHVCATPVEPRHRALNRLT